MVDDVLCTSSYQFGQAPTTTQVTTADHQIRSKVEIDNITLDHLGEWICTISNKNFADSVNKTYVLQYTNPVTLLDSPNLEYYKDNGNDTDNSNADWENHSSIADTYFIVEGIASGSVTGIITARFETFTPDYGKTFDFLRFHNDNTEKEDNQSLFFKIIPGKNGVVSGKKGSPIGTKSLSFEIVKSIQISDLDANVYKIFMGHPGNAESLEYNYGTDTNWKTLKDVRLKDTVKIRCGGRCTVYKYISVCSDSTPRLCGEQLVTENVTLGSPHTLTCTGSGAPYLDVMWTRDKATVPVWTSTYDNTTADHQISSKVEIDNITLDHLGEWICTIRNKNFGDSVNKTYVLQYTNPVTLLDSPNLEYYKNNGTVTEFEWTVKGWPLKQVTLDCGNENISVTRNETGYTTSIPPRIGFNITLSNENVVNCVLKDGNKVLNTRNITRVGYNCTEGEGGVGKDCEVCEPGETSATGVGECFSGKSCCTEGNWGIEGTCYPCPDNQTSSYHAVKPQECFTPAPEPTVPDSGYKTTMLVGWGLAAVFFITTVLLSIASTRKFVLRKCFNVYSENEYIENVITQPPSLSSTGVPNETIYNNHELYEMKPN
ncbi:uncharacterized protein LOC134811984 [Bolinopsis microptera]|uniref:uncharacterized protein LOC134811984 n=1 Tax=Bolinopsis microptera TaxID=2820187 RepID=UPI003078D6CE